MIGIVVEVLVRRRNIQAKLFIDLAHRNDARELTLLKALAQDAGADMDTILSKQGEQGLVEEIKSLDSVKARKHRDGIQVPAHGSHHLMTEKSNAERCLQTLSITDRSYPTRHVSSDRSEAVGS
ncbi:hypothetical protein FMGBMHLM_2466 [Methylobacterium aerolatum]|nr:hypothetical protein FMGBMHLM_2466 [Methylobacterium aerolatum]